MRMVNSTTSSGSTLISQRSTDLSNSNKFSNKSPLMRNNGNKKTSSKPTIKSKASDYNETFGKTLGEFLKDNQKSKPPRANEKLKASNVSKEPDFSKFSARKATNLLRSSMNQRKDFVQEIEGRLRGLRGEKSTPTFKSISKEDIKSFNFENELERLKNTLNDIKDQE